MIRGWQPLFLVLPATTAIAAPDPAAALLAAEDGYIQAVTGRDIAALAAAVSDDLVYIHASGLAQGKKDYLQGTVDAGWAVHAAHFGERHAEVYGRIGIVHGVIGYDVGKGENPARYLAVYRLEGGRWRLLRWQNTKLPKP